MQYKRHDGITDFIYATIRGKYREDISKEDIFYYIYGLLHSQDYRDAFAADLKKFLPRIPLVKDAKDFWAFSNAGRALAELHLHYETQPPLVDVVVTGDDKGVFEVEKIRFVSKEDKSEIIYNNAIRVKNIPASVYDYVVNGKSPIEWIIERYQVTVNKESGIKNDPNDWSREHNQPRYILDLLLSVMTVSVETMKIVEGLPRMDFGE